MRIMVMGGKGQLGSDCTQILEQKHNVISLDLEDIDVAIFADVEKKVADFLPEIIINCAGYTHVDNCETERELAWDVNVKGAENLAVGVQKHGGRLVHISTDYVFDGRKKIPEPYVEDDELNPLSYYGITKLEGEKLVRETTDQHIILRTAWMYGVNGHNFLKTMLKLAVKNPKNEIKVVNDQYGSPTWSHRLALQITKLIDKNCRGTYHASAEGYCSWYQLAKYFLEKMGVPHAVVPCSSAEYPTPAIRPQNSILENRRLKEMDINIMAAWQDDLDRFIAGFGDKLINEALS
ncbi:MAG: dTDP-4-dehydrorhamnose reductase [Candidatus Desulfatibia sp.]|uniref:dTDP-4-dehydrorhamnose reductase n=1 Tax=Candidatus Desulfatibia sp. TaxID=3101189 RepID=UPI002F2EED41